MAALPAVEPAYQMRPGILAPDIRSYYAQSTTTWLQGAILKLVTTGSITTPAPTGSMSTTAGPALAASQGVFNILTSSTSITSGAVTIHGITTASAPARTYYVVVTYTATSNESLPSAEFIVSCPAGLTFSVNVASSGAPAAATNFACYASDLPGFECLQQATKTTTALGSAFTVATSGSFVNVQGIAPCVAGDSANIVGMAVNASDQRYFSGSAGAVGYRSLLGSAISLPPLGPGIPELAQHYVLKLQTADIIQSLVQSWSYSLENAAVGINIDANSLQYTADTTQTQTGNIIQKAGGVTTGPLSTGGFGDTNALVVVRFLSSVLI
jgi:hypothetical protein